MLHSLQALASAAVIERAILLANHVIAGEPVAVQRLQPHAGRCLLLTLEGWPSLLPALPPLGIRITPAGLLEWCGEAAPDAPDLRVSLDASNPALALLQALAGDKPRIEVAGDAQFATDVNWLIDNLRWDLEDDLARLIGDAPARELSKFGSGVASALREAVRGIGTLASRLRGAGPGDPGGPSAR
jgi:ubiquinone biosynthesis protein UbiJ